MIEVRVTAKIPETEHVSRFELTPVNGGELPEFSAGAHIDVQLADGLVRQYSLCSPPWERNRYLIGVLRESASRGGSSAMHDQVQVGERLLISEPRNLFPMAEDAQKSLLIAGGIGITPLLCMAQQLGSAKALFELHYCVRDAAKAAFMEYLREAELADRLHLHTGEGAAKADNSLTRALAQPEPGTHLYVCGPAGFMDYIIETASQHGWAPEQIHREYFSAPTQDTAGDTAFEIVLASSGQSFVIPADQSVIEVLDEAGIELPVSCEQGICGTCITRVIEGIPDHRDQFQTSAEHARNDQFTPCCSRAKTPRLVLDL